MLKELPEILQARKWGIRMSSQVVPVADLQVPGIPDEGELEESAPEGFSDAFVGGDSLGVAREFGSRFVLEDPSQTVHQVDGDGIRIAPMKALQRRSNAGSTRLRDMNEEDSMSGR